MGTSRRRPLRRLTAFASIACCVAIIRLAASSAAEPPDIKPGPGASLQGRQLFPADDPWNQDISKEPVDPKSDALVASIGLKKSLHPDFGTVYNGAPSGIPYIVVTKDQP